MIHLSLIKIDTNGLTKIHFHTGEGISEVDKIINDHGGKSLPSPLIYPPMQLYHLLSRVIIQNYSLPDAYTDYHSHIYRADVTPDTIEVIEAVEDVNDVKDQGPTDE